MLRWSRYNFIYFRLQLDIDLTQTTTQICHTYTVIDVRIVRKCLLNAYLNCYLSLVHKDGSLKRSPAHLLLTLAGWRQAMRTMHAIFIHTRIYTCKMLICMASLYVYSALKLWYEYIIWKKITLIDVLMKHFSKPICFTDSTYVYLSIMYLRCTFFMLYIFVTYNMQVLEAIKIFDIVVSYEFVETNQSIINTYHFYKKTLAFSAIHQNVYGLLKCFYFRT